MKKIFSFFVAIFVAVIMVSGAQAGILVLGPPSPAVTIPPVGVQTPVVYAQEMVNVSLSTAVPNAGGITLELEANDTLPIAGTTGYKLIFTLPSGTNWASTNLNYLLTGGSAVGGIGPGIVTSGGYGTNSLEISFDTTGIVGVNDWAAGEDIGLTTFDPGALIRVTNSSLATAGTSITLTVELRDSGNVLLSRDSLDFMKSTYGFELVSSAPVDGENVTIDCPSGRTLFSIGGTTRADLAGADLDSLTPTEVAGTMQGDGVTAFALVAADRYTIRMLGNYTGVDEVFIDLDADGSLDTDEEPTITGTAPNQTATWTNIAIADWASNGPRNVCMKVDGTTTIENRSFTLECDLDMSDASFNDHDSMTVYCAGAGTAIATGVITAGTAGDTLYNWGHNCYEATTPYMNQSAAYITFVKFYNRSTMDATVVVDVTSDDGTETVTDQTLATTIPAGTVGFFKASDIATELGITAEAFGMRFIVTAPANQVFGTVVQKSTTGQRVMPLYSNGADY